MQPENTGSAADQGVFDQPARVQTILTSNPADPVLFYPRSLALIAGLVSGVLAFGLGKAAHDSFPPELVPKMLSGSEVLKPTLETLSIAEAKNAELVFAILGGALGLLLGAAGGLASRSVSRAVKAATTGLIGGVAVGTLLPLALLVPYSRLQEWRYSDDLLVPLLMHALFWGALGAVGGLAFAIGLGSRHRLRLAFVALLGACLGTAIFEVLGATLDLMASTTDPISKTWLTRLIARVLVAMGTSAAISVSGFPGTEPAKTAEPKVSRHASETETPLTIPS
jgi:hypothetical protein